MNKLFTTLGYNAYMSKATLTNDTIWIGPCTDNNTFAGHNYWPDWYFKYE